MAQVAELYLDVKKTGHYTNDIINLRVGDNTDQIIAHIMLNGEPHQNIESATFFAEKPDETIIANDPANVVDPSTISYPIPEQLTAAAGNITKAYFIINTTSSTDSFKINILPSVNPKGDSLDYIPGLENINKFLKFTEADWLGRIQQMKSQIDGLSIPDEFKVLMDKALSDAKAQYQPIIDAAQENVESIAADLAAKKLDLTNNSDELNQTIADIKAQLAPVNSFLDDVQKQIIAANASFTADQQAKVAQSISDLKAQIDALGVLEIGGRNYLLDSENYNENYWLRNIGIFGDVLNDSFNGTKIVQTNVNWGGPKYSVDNLKERGLLDDTSQSWTFSAYARTTTNVTAEINFFGLDSAIDAGTVGQNWKRISVTFKFLNPNSTISFSPIGLDKVPATVQFSGYKLEKGNISTDWCPNPSEILTQSDYAKIKAADPDMSEYATNDSVDTKLGDYSKSADIAKDYAKKGDVPANALTIWKGSADDYAALTSKDDSTEYNIVDDTGIKNIYVGSSEIYKRGIPEGTVIYENDNYWDETTQNFKTPLTYGSGNRFKLKDGFSFDDIKNGIALGINDSLFTNNTSYPRIMYHNNLNYDGISQPIAGDTKSSGIVFIHLDWNNILAMNSVTGRCPECNIGEIQTKDSGTNCWLYKKDGSTDVNAKWSGNNWFRPKINFYNTGDNFTFNLENNTTIIPSGSTQKVSIHPYPVLNKIIAY